MFIHMITNYEAQRHKHFSVIQKNKQTGKDLITKYIYNNHICMNMSDDGYILFTKRKW